MASKSQGDISSTTSKTIDSGKADSSVIGTALGTAAGLISVGLNTAMTWVLGDKTIESQERIANANIQAQGEIAIAQARLRSQTSNTVAIFGAIILLVVIMYVLLK